VLENPRKCNFTTSALLKVQSIAIGGGLSCAKQADPNASNIITIFSELSSVICDHSLSFCDCPVESKKRQNLPVKCWELVSDKLSKAG